MVSGYVFDMRLLKEFDYKDYKVDGTVGRRPSVRAIIIRDNRLAMVYSARYDYYMFAGGGIEEGEDMGNALIREIKEELGLEVISDSIKEYGLIVRKEKGMFDDLFFQENYFYTCDVTDIVINQNLEDYENFEQYELRWVTPEEAIETNLTHSHEAQANQVFTKRFMDRECWLIRNLMEAGFFS